MRKIANSVLLSIAETTARSKMHRFQLIQKNAGTPYIYALMDGNYFGGNTDSDIICLTPTTPVSNQKRFRLVVLGNVVKLSSNNTMIYINGTAQETPLKKRILKHGDLIGIGCSTTPECIEDPTCHVFELIKREKPTPKSTNRWPCYHPPTEHDVLKTQNRVDCRYPNCFFACWNIADLNEHMINSQEHIAAFEKQKQSRM